MSERGRNLTVRLDVDVVRKAKALAAARGTSISGFLAREIESMVKEEEAYEAARREALSLLEAGFRLGGAIPSRRDEWHER
jgi:predicted transcriptional regulator